MRRGLAGIDHLDGIIGGRQLEVALAGALEEADLLQLDAVQLAAMTGTRQADGGIDIKVEGQVRLEIAEHGPLDGADEVRIDAAAAPLIGLGGEIVAIAHHPDAIGQRRLDAGLHQLYPGCVHQQQFGLQGQALVVHLLDDGPHPLRQRRAPRLTGAFDPLDAMGPEIVGHIAHRGALPCPFQSFNHDKFRH